MDERRLRRLSIGIGAALECAATAVAKWLLGLSGGGTVLAFGFYVQSYLSILSIKNDCVSLRFVGNANLGASYLARWYLVSGGLALLAIAFPTAIGIGRNVLRWWKALKWPPLQPGHEFDGWYEYQVAERITFWQCALVVYSAYLFFAMTLSLPFSTIGSTPEGVRAEWHPFEVTCSLPQPPDDQGVS
jgi:hypothetical protein